MTTVKPIVEERQHHSWGLLVQGRPATPSEGRAQQYTRIGCKDTQSLITHNNGTCLEFGPWDLVDEFDATKPFYQQVLLIDTTIKDIQSVRVRHNDQVGDEVDVFKGFRTIPYTGEIHQHVYPNGETYTQVPSYYASVSNTASMYSTTNKSDIIGEAHPGLSSDTRFGVLVPNQSQNQNQGRGGNSYRGNDRQNGRSNQHYGERGGCAQLNRRGRRDTHFGRGQGRGQGRGDGRGHVRESTRGGRHFESGGHHHNTSSTQNGNNQRREDDYDEERWWGQPAPREILAGYQDEADRSYPSYDEDDRQYSNYKPYHPDDHTYLGPNGEGFPHLTLTHGQQAPIYRGFEEAYPLIPPPNAVLMSYNGPINPYAHPVPIEGNPYGFPNFYQSMQSRVPFNSYTSSSAVYSPESEMESHVGGHSPYFVPGHDVGVDVSMGSDNGHEATNPRPRVVLPPTTPGGQTYVSYSAGYEGHLRANVHPPTPFGPSAGRSPMRTTTNEGSPLMRPRRHATDPNMSFTPLTHARTTSGSGTDLRRLATGNSGFAIAEPRSSPSASAFSPGSGSPRHVNMDSMTARSSPGMSFSNLSVVGGPMTRNASSHELKYAGYSIPGQSIPSSGLVSRTSTPLANPGRRWFESRQFVPDGSRLSSPGVTSPCQNSRIWAEPRSEDGQM